jgi:hypothetical protein
VIGDVHAEDALLELALDATYFDFVKGALSRSPAQTFTL